MDAKRFFMFLLALDEVVVGAKFLQHVGRRHRAAIGLVAEVDQLTLRRTARETKREQRIGLHRETEGSLIVLFPDVFVGTLHAL